MVPRPMNIFFLDPDPRLAAQYHCDKHVVKMVLETAQLLSGVVHLNNPADRRIPDLYSLTHANHPCAVWARAKLDNYAWLYQLGISCRGLDASQRCAKLDVDS